MSNKKETESSNLVQERLENIKKESRKLDIAEIFYKTELEDNYSLALKFFGAAVFTTFLVFPVALAFCLSGILTLVFTNDKHHRERLRSLPIARAELEADRMLCEVADEAYLLESGIIGKNEDE